MLSVVVVHHRMPEARLGDWCAWNDAAIRGAQAQAWIVSDIERAGLPEWARCLVFPASMPIFSISRTANFGIRSAIDAGAEAVLKTDVDCILSAELLAAATALRPGRALCPRYWMADGTSQDDMRRARVHPQLIGTLGMHRDDWSRVCGYRETLEGYGVDDCDIRDRALRAVIRVPLSIEPRLWHIAHEAGTPQIGGLRGDQWGRETGQNPRNHAANRARLAEPWSDQEWGRPHQLNGTRLMQPLGVSV